MFRKLMGAAALVSLGLPAQATETDIDEVRREVGKIRAEYEARISELEQRLARAERLSLTPQPNVEAGKTSGAPATAARQPESAAGFNPAISVVLNGTAAVAKNDPAAYRVPGFALGDEARPIERGFALGESEVTLSANIDHTLYGALTVALAGDNTVAVEEAFIQTTSLPWGLGVKAGRFKSAIGYLNEQHAHTWDFADAPLPYLLMLAPQYADDGLQLRWLAPVGMFLDFGAEGFRGASFPGEGAGNKGMGAWSIFAHLGDDIGAAGEGGSWRVGFSQLRTHANDRSTNSGTDIFKGNNTLSIIDATYKWAPNGNFADTYVKIQGEYFHMSEDGLFNDIRDHSTRHGYYAQMVYQFMPQWRAGLRYDRAWAEANAELSGTTADAGGHVAQRKSVMIDYSTSEFGRFRLQGNLDSSLTTTDRQLVLQYTVSLGAHGAHPF